MKVAFFPGSFNPFTVGHARIVERALPLFDKIIIAFGINTSKEEQSSLFERIEELKDYYASEPKVGVISYKDLTVDAARQHGAKFILRGVRSIADFEYERNIADINHELSDVETVILCAEPQYAIVSSSMVRELAHFGKDVSKYLVKKK